MVTQIVKGVYQLKVPIPNNPLENTNIYLVQGDKSYTLIDTGWDSETAFNSINRQLAEVGVGFQDISQIIITHAHFDHFALVGRIKELNNAKIFIHRQEQQVLRSRYAVSKEYLDEVLIGFRTNGVPEEMLAAVHGPISGFGKSVPAQPDVLLSGDETLTSGAFNLKVIWTPGHSPGHICLYEPEHKILFSGDHILRVITPNVSLPPNSTGNPLGEYIKSKDSPVRIASEYVNIADKYARDNHLGRYRVIPTWGATEAFLPEDADMLIENTETGRTIARHNLKIIDTLFESTGCVIGRKTSDPLKRKRIEAFVAKLRTATSAG